MCRCRRTFRLSTTSRVSAREARRDHYRFTEESSRAAASTPARRRGRSRFTRRWSNSRATALPRASQGEGRAGVLPAAPDLAAQARPRGRPLVPTSLLRRLRAYLGNAVFVPIGRSADTTFQLDLYSEGYVASATSCAGRRREARASCSQLRPRPDTDEWSGACRPPQPAVSRRLRAARRGDRLLRHRLLPALRADLDYNTLRSLYSYVTFSRNWGPQAANFRADHARRFRGFTGTSTVVLERRPESSTGCARRRRRQPFYCRCRVARRLTPTARDATRLLHPPRPVPASRCCAGCPAQHHTRDRGRATYYSKRYSEDRTTFEEEPIYRRYVTAAIGRRTSFSRSGPQGDQDKH